MEHFYTLSISGTLPLVIYVIVYSHYDFYAIGIYSIMLIVISAHKRLYGLQSKKESTSTHKESPTISYLKPPSGEYPLLPIQDSHKRLDSVTDVLSKAVKTSGNLKLLDAPVTTSMPSTLNFNSKENCLKYLYYKVIHIKAGALYDFGTIIYIDSNTDVVTLHTISSKHVNTPSTTLSFPLSLIIEWNPHLEHQVLCLAFYY